MINNELECHLAAFKEVYTRRGSSGRSGTGKSMDGVLQRVRDFLSWTGSLGCLRKKKITRGQRQLQKLKTQVDELSQRLRSLEMMADAVAIKLSGSGPFCLPLVSQFNSLFSEEEDQLLIGFELEGGKQVYARMPCLVAAQVVNDDVALPLQNTTVDASSSIEPRGPTDAFQLPTLYRYKGHFYVGCERVLAFLTEESQTVFLPLSTQSYEKLLQQFEAALVSSAESGVSEPGFGVRLAYPLRSRR